MQRIGDDTNPQQSNIKEDNKKGKDGTSMERADIEKKVEMIAGKSGKELKQTIMKMYPNLFKVWERWTLNITSS